MTTHSTIIDGYSAMQLLRSAAAQLWRELATTDPRVPAAFLLTPLLAAAIWLAPTSLSIDGRIALIVTVCCLVGWGLTRLADSLVALAGALAMVGFGVLPADRLYDALGDELVWLLIGAFVISGILKASGLIERFASAALRPFRSIAGLFFALTMVISATAFLVPSTSARAALLLPLFLSLAERLPDSRLVRPMALLFPTMILLSAGGSILGAGAHFIAIDAIAAKTGAQIGFLQWIMLALPVSLASCVAACLLILQLFVPDDLRHAAIEHSAAPTTPLNSRQKRIVAVVLVIMAAWMTQSLHGFDIAIVTLAGATVLMSRAFTDMKPKDLLRSVELELVLFLVATAVITDGTTAAGADRWIASTLVANLPPFIIASTPLIVAVVAAIAVLAHLLINSRSARAAVLIPVLALPLAGMGHDLTTLVMVTVLGTGFCQTMMASAKPVAMFGSADRPTFGQADLFRLALPLLPVKFALLVAAALLLWPSQIVPSTPKVETAQSALAIEPPGPVAVATKIAPAHPHPGALCTREELRTVMIAQIAQRRMWASGWWRVWKRLERQGLPLEQVAVKTIYREDDLVRLRANSLQLQLATKDETAIGAAISACKGLRK